MKPKFVILEYGVAEGATNPFGYDPWSLFTAWPREYLPDDDYWYNENVPMPIRSSRHMAEILGVINKYKKFDFEIVTLQYENAKKYLDANKDSVFVVSASVGAFFNDDFMAQYKDSFYMCISAGNEDIEGEGLGSSKPYWTSIGAVTPSLEPAEYSSWGKGLVQFVGVAGEEITFDYFGRRTAFIQGTSFACPQHATQIMNLMMNMYNKTGQKPFIKDVLNIRNKFTKDITGNFEGVEQGKDLRTGFGYFEWVDGITYTKEIEMKIGSSDIIVNNNGFTSIIQSPVPTQVINGTTVLPLRVIAQLLNVTIKYDPLTKTINLFSS